MNEARIAELETQIANLIDALPSEGFVDQPVMPV